MTRTRDITRLEGFSDAVFGFALTLLAVQVETPVALADLRHAAGRNGYRGGRAKLALSTGHKADA